MLWPNTLVIAAHPDDDVLGCGGLMSGLSQMGNKVRVIYVCDGVTSRDGATDDDMQRREAETEAANKILGVTEWQTLGLADNQLDAYPLLTVIKLIERYVAEWEPQCILTHSMADLNIDHRRTAEAALTAARPFASTVKGVYGFEVPSATECGWGTFRPVLYSVGDLARKLEAVKAYKDELRTFPHPRSIEGISALAMKRGSECGLRVAEAFEVYRCILG